MQVSLLSLKNFRSHEETTVSFGDGLNLLFGPNGAGKTNVLEALHFLCLGKSFLTSNDRLAVRIGAGAFEVKAELDRDQRSSVSARIAFVPGEGKRIDVGGAPLDRISDVVGRFPIVVMAPSDHRLTEDGPDERRRFLDTMLCQAAPAYLDTLMRYRRVLKQRNQLLAARRGTRELLPTFDAALIKHGADLVARRHRFIQNFRSFLQNAYGLLEAGTEQPAIRYRTFFDTENTETTASDVAETFRAELERRQSQELERGVTLVGPHRDDLDFRLNGMSVRRYASQGQHRTFVIGLKLAQYFYLADRLGERPVLLLDDVFDTLDPDRVRIFAVLLCSSDFGQSIVTAARRDVFESALSFDGVRSRATPIRATIPTA